MYLFEKRQKFVTPSFVESCRIIRRIAILMNSKVTLLYNNYSFPFFEKREGKSRKDNKIVVQKLTVLDLTFFLHSKCNHFDFNKVRNGNFCMQPFSLLNMLFLSLVRIEKNRNVLY